MNSWCYHGSVDESLIVTSPDGPRARPGNVGAPCDVTLTSRVVEYNDLDGLERALAHGDVAVVLMEPALTNMGIVLPEPGYLDGVRRLTRAAGTLLIIDETHTLSAGPGGCTAAWGLEPDIVTLGKAIGGGIPIGAYGLRCGAGRAPALPETSTWSTPAGSAARWPATPSRSPRPGPPSTRSLTDDAFDGMIALCTRYNDGVERIIAARSLPWSVSQLGAPAGVPLRRPAPRNGTESEAATDVELEDYLHLFLLNRGILLTPFHNMALMCPATTEADVDLHLQVLDEAVALLSPTTSI